MDFVRDVFPTCIPHSIEADWGLVHAPRLAGFPVNICYASLARRVGTGTQDPETYIYRFAIYVRNRAPISPGATSLFPSVGDVRLPFVRQPANRIQRSCN